MELLPQDNEVGGSLKTWPPSDFSIKWEGNLWQRRWFEELEPITTRARPAERLSGETIALRPKPVNPGHVQSRSVDQQL